MKAIARVLILGLSLSFVAVLASDGGEDFEKGKLAYQEKNYGEAFHYFTNAAETGHADAQFWLGSMYQSDDYGLQADLAKMYNWFERAAQNGNARAAFEVASRNTGSWIWPDDDYSETIPLLERAAELGHGEAMIQLTAIYARDHEHHADKEKEVYWTQRAAEAGQKEGQFQLSQMYFKGYGVERDENAAASWLQAAARNGHDGAQYEYGMTLFRGLLGQEANKELALEWIKLACRNENSAAFGFLSMAFLTGDGVAKDTEVAYNLLVESVRLGDDDAAFKLAEVFAGGGFGEQDIETALTWLHIAEKRDEHPGVAAARANIKREIGYDSYLLKVAEGRADACVRSGFERDWEAWECRTGIPSEEERQATEALYDLVSGSDE